MIIDNNFKSIHMFFDKTAYKRTRKLKCLYEEFFEKAYGKDILLCDAQSLFYDFLEALRNAALHQWRDSLLNKKYILIDGFHYFEEKKSALEELTYIFKHTNAAIFLTLNKPLAQCNFGEEMRYILSTGTQKEISDESYALSAAEAVWQIKQSNDLTLEEKHQAWTEIMDNLPDCAFISEDYPEANIDSVHTFLSEYMDLEKRLLERYYKKESNAVYTYRVWCDEDGDWIGGEGPLYVDFAQALAEFNNDADLCPSLALFTKVYFGAEYQRIYVYMRPDGAVTKVAADLIDLKEKEYKIFYEIFYGMDIVFKSKSKDKE